MSREILLYTHELKNIIDFAPIPIGYVGWIWHLLKERKSRRTGIPIEELEVNHNPALWENGSDQTSELTAESHIEHAFFHRDRAKAAKDTQTRRREYGALRLIQKRMTPQEKGDFDILERLDRLK